MMRFLRNLVSERGRNFIPSKLLGNFQEFALIGNKDFSTTLTSTAEDEWRREEKFNRVDDETSQKWLSAGGKFSD